MADCIRLLRFLNALSLELTTHESLSEKFTSSTVILSSLKRFSSLENLNNPFQSCLKKKIFV